MRIGVVWINGALNPLFGVDILVWGHEYDAVQGRSKKAMGNDTIGMSFSFHHLRLIKKGKIIINGITGSIPGGTRLRSDT